MMIESNTMESIDLEVEVTEILHKARVPANIKGFEFLRTAIMLSVNDSGMVHSITKSLYPTVAKQYQTTSPRAERAIRHAIELAWDRGAGETLSTIFHRENIEDKPCNSEFIAAIADHLRLNQKRKAIELDESELEPPRPLSAERRAEIDEINNEIAALVREICEMG